MMPGYLMKKSLKGDKPEKKLIFFIANINGLKK
jgi:hypothetical protein